MIYVGVDIGSCAVKAAAIKTANKTFTVLQTHIFPIKPDVDEEQKRLLKLGHLKTLADLYNSTEAQYIFCFSQNEVSSEKLSFPFKERYKIMKSLPYQMEEKLSLFDHKKLISDIKMSHFSEGARQVLVFSAFRDSISNLIKDLDSVKIKPLILTCEASAVSNLFEIKKSENIKQNSTEDDKNTNCQLYLKIGHTHTMAMLFSRNQLQNVYSFGWGAASCIRKIALKYEIPFSKAMEYFCEKAFVLTHTKGYTGSQIEFSKLIHQAVDNLIDKLRLLMIQLAGEKNYKCEKILLLGGGAQIRNLQAFMSTHLNVPVSRVEHPAHFPKWNLRHNDEQQNNLVTALGSAMEGLKRTRSPAINFLKEEFTVRSNPFSFLLVQWKQPLVWGISALVLLFVYSALRNYQSETLSDKTNRLFKKKSIQIVKISPTQINVEMVKKFISSKRKITKQAELIEKISLIPSALDKVKSLSVSINKKKSWNMEIQELNIMGDKVEIKGEIAVRYLPFLEKNLIQLAAVGSLKALEKKQLQNTESKEKSENESSGKTESDTVFFKYSFIQKQG